MEGNNDLNQIITLLEISYALLNEAYQEIDCGSDSEADVEVTPVTLSEIARNTVLPYYLDEQEKEKHLEYSVKKDLVKATPIVEIRDPKNKIEKVFDFAVVYEQRHLFSLLHNGVEYRFIPCDIDELNKANIFTKKEVEFLVDLTTNTNNVDTHMVAQTIITIYNKLIKENISVIRHNK